MPNIYLIGMMGSGKSVTAKSLAAQLGYDFSDLDDLIQKKCRKTTVQIFADHGEDYFRDAESETLQEAGASGTRVIATGGGTILRPKNVEWMHQTGKIIYLETSPEILWERVRDKKDRPLLRGEDPKTRLMQILSTRLPLYQRAGDLKVNTDGKTAHQVAEEICQLLKGQS